MITRLQLGTSRLENLPPKIRQVFLDKSWMHFGDQGKEKFGGANTVSSVFEMFRRYSLSYIFTLMIQKIIAAGNSNASSIAEIGQLYDETNFTEFYYQKGDRLPFDDNAIDFIYSEHFFEHLFPDEAVSLLQECNRILKPFGVIRTCVPDADLRTYEPPEPIGYPDIKLQFTDPSKHKTRWSVYSFGQVLEFAGFESIPLHYCDKSGQYIKRHPSLVAGSYDKCPEQEMIFNLNYIIRMDSLIVDGVKKPSQ